MRRSFNATIRTFARLLGSIGRARRLTIGLPIKILDGNRVYLDKRRTKQLYGSVVGANIAIIGMGKKLMSHLRTGRCGKVVDQCNAARAGDQPVFDIISVGTGAVRGEVAVLVIAEARGLEPLNSTTIASPS